MRLLPASVLVLLTASALHAGPATFTKQPVASKTGDITRSGKIWGYQGLDRSMSTVSIADGLLYIAQRRFPS